VASSPLESGAAAAATACIPSRMTSVVEMSSWFRVVAVRDFQPGISQEFVVDGRIVALLRVGDEFFALDGICPHQGGPLGKGRLTGCIVTCPWHGWQFDVRTGQHQVNQSIRHASFPVKIEEGDVFVDLSG
jgi:nitrite reductase (NADH) small subunit